MRVPCFLLILCLLYSCGKPSIVPPDTITTDLTITQTNTPGNVSQNQSIVSAIHMTGPNLCYKFSYLEVNQLNPLLYEIRAKGTIPNPDRGTVVCQTAVYQKDTTLTVPAHLTGKYVLRFFNGPQLFQADTVRVN
jgi:hypothetical protein